jgi:chromosome segregation ATPase
MDRKVFLFVAKKATLIAIASFKKYYHKYHVLDGKFKNLNAIKRDFEMEITQIKGLIDSYRCDNIRLLNTIKETQEDITTKSNKDKKKLLKEYLAKYKEKERNVQDLIKNRQKIQANIDKVEKNISQINIDLSKAGNKMMGKKTIAMHKINDLVLRSEKRTARISRKIHADSRDHPKMADARTFLDNARRIKNEFDDTYNAESDMDEYQTFQPCQYTYSSSDDDDIL